MPIKIQGQVSVDAPRQEVWDSILDLQVLKNTAAHVPGVDVERLDQIDDTHYEGTATNGVAAVKGKYDGTITILEKRAPEFMRMKGE
ncbi:MAG: SRPBCC domain-containing protein, partial [Chloroflexi bacterium]|nr:SRPBCC domain-containing protein [Chloroflexota bacterium]